MTLVTFFPSVTCELFFRFIALSMTNNKWRNERKKANTQKKLFGLSVKGKGCPDASLKMPSQYYRKWAIENVNEHTKQTKQKKNRKILTFPLSLIYLNVSSVLNLLLLSFASIIVTTTTKNRIESKQNTYTKACCDWIPWNGLMKHMLFRVVYIMCVCLAEPIRFCSQKICDIIYVYI